MATAHHKIKLKKPNPNSLSVQAKSNDFSGEILNGGIGVRKRDDKEYKFYSAYQLKTHDSHANLIIHKRMSAKKLVFYQWLTSYCWQSTDGIRHTCKFNYASLGKMWNVSKGTIGKWLGTLTKLGLVRVTYIVKNNRTSRTTVFHDHKVAFAYMEENGGFLERTEILTLENGLCVFPKKTKGVVP